MPRMAAINEDLEMWIKSIEDYEKLRGLLRKKGGPFLRALRKKRGLSQRELAAILKLHYTYISKIEKGELPLSFNVIKKLSKLPERR